MHFLRFKDVKHLQLVHHCVQRLSTLLVGVLTQVCQVVFVGARLLGELLCGTESCFEFEFVAVETRLQILGKVSKWHMAAGCRDEPRVLEDLLEGLRFAP